ncbi:MAG: 2-amino-4-hydroxy-6-hydroxymethyldihydropteridine diphosphokinase [Candidatus Vecturithrix sp.]|jgi:dihydroneopterin aldolase/2-amino-4-hydroxy-6-hydroxymethyldihydropteridine diphosphokinase|nr:2-amino-4-hydroxy-6-hydroxymethyldihydropteridine diphosphokinase [Candidatus Vecturithrix sp.]
MIEAYIGVGSNIDPEQHLVQGLQHLRQRVDVTAVSTVYQTEPLERPEQSAYLNAVWRINTTFPARFLKFEVLRRIESILGRVRTGDPYQARTLDFDLLLYGDQMIQEPDLLIPDPDLRKRAFIAVPLAELNPSLRLPGTHEPITRIISGMDASDLTPVPLITQRLQRMLAS